MIRLMFILLALPLLLSAQTTVADAPIDRMMTKWIEQNRATKKVSGWRVQLIATTDRRKMDEVLTSFKTNFPDIAIDWQHDKPYYKVQAGACTTKIEAMALQMQLRSAYPSGYIIQSDSISPADLAY